MADPNNKSIEEELEEYMQSQGQQSSATPSVPAPEEDDGRDPSLRTDLLSQIAGDDLKEEKEKKKPRKKISFSKLFAAFMIRATLKINECRHKFATPIRMLEFIWCVFIFIVYIGGIASLTILVHVYLNYPNYVEDFFVKNRIELSSWNMGNYTLSRIELTNLKSKDGSFSIRKVVIRSDFSDFLLRRIKTVNLEGTTLKIRETGDKLEMGKLAELLMNLHLSANSGYRIGSISMPNATLNIEGEKFNLPVQLSVNGVYEKSPSVSIPLSIKQKYINISGLLSMGGSGKNLDWTLDISSGILTFPNRQPENVTGKFKIRTDGLNLSSVNGNLDLVYGKNTKKIKVDLKKNKKVFRGTIGVSLINQEVRDKSDETQTDIQMVFEGLDIKNLSKVSSTQPIRFNIQSFYAQDFSVSNASGVFRGNLDCQNFDCSYEIKSNVPVSVQSSRFAYYGNNYVSTERTMLTLKPTKKKNIAMNNNGLQFDFDLADISYKGLKNKNNKINTAIKTMKLNGQLSGLNQQSKLGVNAQGVDYSSNEVEFQKGVLDIGDVWADDTSLQFKSASVSLVNNRLIKVPFAIAMRREKGIVGASLGMLNNKMQIRYVGAANLSAGTFAGRIQVMPFNIGEVSQNLNSISDLFPSEIQNVSGQLAAIGNIVWQSEKQVDGPFYLMVKDVDFTAGDVKVNGMHSVLNVQSLVPFITAGGQQVYAESIDTVLPFRNVNAILKFDNQLMRISRLSTEIGGLDLGMDNVNVKYKANSVPMSLKNADADLSKMNNYWKLPGFTINGKGSVELSLELKDNKFYLQEGEKNDIRLSNAVLKYTGDDAAIRNALFQHSDEYRLRSGIVSLTQGEENNMNAYLNFEGRMMPDQIKTTFTDTIQFKLSDVLNLSTPVVIPLQIQQHQRTVEAALEKQK